MAGTENTTAYEYYDDVTTEATNQLPARHPLWFDDSFYRQLITTHGEQCYDDIRAQGLTLSVYQKACLCTLLCFHRQLTPEESALKAEIVAGLAQTILDDRILDKWPYMVAYLTLSVLGMAGELGSVAPPTVPPLD